MLMSWWRKESGHQQPCYCLCWAVIIRSAHVKGYWGRVTHRCVSRLTTIGSDNGLSPGWRQAIIWTSVGILLIGPLGTNFNEIVIQIHTSSFNKMHLKMSSVKWRPFCLGLSVLISLLLISVSERNPGVYGPVIWLISHTVYNIFK